jgi:DNA-binding MarR family transcriptional regulator
MAGSIRVYGRPNERLTILSNEFVRRSDIKPTAFRVAVYVMSHGEDFRLTQAGIAKAVGLARETVGSAFAELEELGLLIRVRCTDEHGHRAADDLFISQEPFTEEQAEALSRKNQHGDSQRGDSRQPKKTNELQEDQEEITASLRESEPEQQPTLFRADLVPVKKQPRRKPRTAIPEDWRATEAHIAQAKQDGWRPDAFRDEVRKFRNYYQAEGKPMADWNAAFRNWMINAKRFGRNNAGSSGWTAPSGIRVES